MGTNGDQWLGEWRKNGVDAASFWDQEEKKQLLMMEL
jgi:hypothetical protein